MQEKVEIYTDGSCYPNPGGKGGWGFIVVIDDQEIHRDSGGADNTTNNRMEMTAIIKAMEFCEQEVPHNNIVIYTDNKYCKNGYHKWMRSWERYNWRTSSGSIPENLDLWKQMYNLQGYTIEWVKGHADNKWNNKTDEIVSYKNFI